MPLTGDPLDGGWRGAHLLRRILGCAGVRGRIGVSRSLGILAVVCVIPGCASRERTNPFDPDNPDTGGTPALLRVLADDRSVHLRWDLSGFEGVRQVRILRQPEGGAEETAYFYDGAGPGAELDSLVENGRTTAYRLEVGAQPTPLSTAVVQATPGGSEPWVGDASGGGVVRLTPDGRGVLFRAESGRDLVGLAMEEDGSLWAADYGYDAVIRIARDGERREVFDLEGANTLAVDAADGRLWVGSFDQRTVFLLEGDGRIDWADPGAGLVENVRAAPGGGAWVASRDHTVSLLREGAVLFREDDFAWPLGLACDRAGRAWVTDRDTSGVHPHGGVYRYEPGGVRREKSPVLFSSPRDVEPDGDDGAWVADPELRGGGVAHLDRSLHEQGFVPCPGAEAVAWDPVNRRLWVCRPTAGRLEVFVAAPGGAGEEMRHFVSLYVGGRPVVVRGAWRR
jgi:hypothetical protein